MVLFLSLIFCKQEEKLLFFGSVSGCTCLILLKFICQYDKNNNVSFECLVIYVVTSITAHYVNHIGGVIIIMLSSSPVDHGFKT